MLLDEALEQDKDTEVFMDEDSIDIRSRVESALAEFQASPPSLAEILVADQQSHCLESSGPLQRVERNGWVCIGGVNGLTDTTQEPLMLEDEVHNLFRNLKGALISSDPLAKRYTNRRPSNQLPFIPTRSHPSSLSRSSSHP